MFDQTSDTPNCSIGLCIVQLFFAPLGCLAFGVLIGGFFEELLHVIMRDRTADLLLGYVVFIVVGFAFGYLTQTVLPRARQSGGPWVWIVPCCILTWGVLDQSRAPGTVIGTYFVFTPGDEGLGVALITWPAVATCFYSVGVVLASRPAKTGPGAAFRKIIVRSPLNKLARMF